MSERAYIKGKTEHAGPKRGKGAWCRKVDAKQAAKRERRTAGKRLIAAALDAARIVADGPPPDSP